MGRRESKQTNKSVTDNTLLTGVSNIIEPRWKMHLHNKLFTDEYQMSLTQDYRCTGILHIL